MIFKNEVMEMYEQERKMGSDDFKRKYKAILDKSIEDLYIKIDSELLKQIELRRKALEAEEYAIRFQDERDKQQRDFNMELKKEREASKAREDSIRNQQIQYQTQMDAMMNQVQS